MTEAKWNTCVVPIAMLDFIGEKVSERKLRLFGVACCRRIWSEIHMEFERQAVDLAERYADGACLSEDLALQDEQGWPDEDRRNSSTSEAAATAVRTLLGRPFTIDCAVIVSDLIDLAWHSEEMLKEQSAILRDITGPAPFRPIVFNPGWVTSTVMALAEAIYEDRAFDRLPILADALEEAGCSQPDILSHLRGGGEHCRGCWGLDLVLGKG